MKLLSSLALSALLLSSLLATASADCVPAADFVADDATQKYCPPDSELYKADCCPSCGKNEMCTQEEFVPPDVAPMMVCPEVMPEAGACAVHSTISSGELRCGYDKHCGATVMGTMRRRASEGKTGECVFIMTMTCGEGGAWVAESEATPEGYKSCDDVCARRRSRRLLFATHIPPDEAEESVAELCGC